MVEVTLPTRSNRKAGLQTFANQLEALVREIGMKLSSRGWAYQLEGFNLITKDKFDVVENIINECRKKGYLPVDFTAEEEARKFAGIEIPETDTIPEYLKSFISATLNSAEYYTPEWWDGEEYYIQMLVEKIDVKNLFYPTAHKYHIPIATSKGWSSIIQRAEYSKRFKKAEDLGLKCVLLYCGDHDPDGLRISNTIRKNLHDIENVYWNDGTRGYDPTNLIIDRFGLNYNFIIENKLTWIDNLITGTGKNLASPTHRNYNLPYVQNYLGNYGARKCEANALIKEKIAGKQLCIDSIEKYLRKDALDRFKKKRQAIRDETNEFFGKTGLDGTLRAAIDLIDEEEE